MRFRGHLSAATIALSIILCSAWMGIATESCQITFTNFSGRGTLMSFPAMVKLGPHIPAFTYDNFLSPNGYDLRFWTNATFTGTEVNYEIEEWDTGGTSYVWVQVPALTHNGSIWASWGDPAYNSQAPYTTNGDVWSEDFRAVFHLNEAVTDEQTTGVYDDSSPNENSGAQNGTSVGTGVSAQCANFDGVGDFIIVSNESDYDFKDKITASVWFRTSGGWNGIWQMFLTKGSDQHWDLRRYSGTQQVEFITDNDNTGCQGPATNVADDAWHHFVGVYDQADGRGRAYIDGHLYHVDTTPDTDLILNNEPLQISGRQGGTTAWLNHRGLIDEVRVSRAARSADWIWACWMNQGDNHGAFVDYGTVVTHTPGMPTLASATVTDITTTNALASVVLGGTNAYVTLFWGTNNADQTFTWAATNRSLASSLQPTGTLGNVAIGNLMADTRYFYIFYASNSVSGLESWSAINQSFGSGLNGKAVTNLSATAPVATAINLAWTDNFNTETGYVIERSPNGSSWAHLTTTAAGASSYTHTGLSEGSTHHYRIAAENASGLSDWSATARATTPSRPHSIATDFSEATFAEVGLLRDIPSPALASITLDAANDRLAFATTGNTDMWGARNNAPIGYVLKPAGPLWFMQAELELASTGSQQVFGFTVYADIDGARPDFTYGLDYWNPVTPMVKLQGLGDNDPVVNVSAEDVTRVILRIEVEDDGGGPGIARYTCKYDLLDGAGMQTLTTYDSSFSNARVGVAIKTGNNGRTAFLHNLEIDDVGNEGALFLLQ